MPVDSDRILDLKVADIACGSGAFLVAAARYLADRLVEAWQREEAVTGMTPRELETHAIRTVIATCLYGADINAMAVEMCKLSLWLVSLDPKLPFSFVDDKILHGNSLLGLTDVRQLKRQHIDPDAASPQQSLYEADVDGVLRQAKQLRQRLASEVDDSDPQRSTNTKRRQWHRYQEITAELTEIADAVIADRPQAGRQARPGAQRGLREPRHRPRQRPPDRRLEAQPGHARRHPQRRASPPRSPPTTSAGSRCTGSSPSPTSWNAAASTPSSATRRSSAAQKLTGAMGTNIRDWFVNVLANGKTGSADLVAYFFLRAMLVAELPGQPRPDRHEYRRPRGHSRGRPRPDGREWIHDHPCHPEPILASQLAPTWNTPRCGALAATVARCRSASGG